MVQEFLLMDTVPFDMIETEGGGVICCVTNKICCNTENCISNEIENIFIKLLFQKQNQLQLELFINLQIKQGF